MSGWPLQFFFKKLFIYWLLWIFIAMCGLCLVAVSRGFSWLWRGRRLLIVVASLVEQGLYSPGSILVVLGLSCSRACRILLDQGLNQCLLRWQADS